RDPVAGLWVPDRGGSGAGIGVVRAAANGWFLRHAPSPARRRTNRRRLVLITDNKSFCGHPPPTRQDRRRGFHRQDQPNHSTFFSQRPATRRDRHKEPIMQAIRTMTALAALFALGSAAQAATEAEGLAEVKAFTLEHNAALIAEAQKMQATAEGYAAIIDAH